MGRKKLDHPLTPEEKKKWNEERQGSICNPLMNMEPGDNARFINQGLEIANLPKLNIYHCTLDELQGRFNEFFTINAKYNTKPTVAGMAMALGIDRRTLWSIRTDSPINGQGDMSTIPRTHSDCIKKNYTLMENLWENYMQNGKINPVSGIFLGKNNFGYQDKVEHVITPNVEQNDFNADEIRQRYLIDSNDSNDSEED